MKELRSTLAEIEKRKTTGEYNLNASIEVEKKLKAVVDLDSFDSDTLKLILDRVLIKADGTEESDIDIAVFGNQSKGKVLTSKQFMKFADELAEFDDFLQSYDILYFKTGKEDNSAIMAEINKGEVLYVRE